MGAEVDEKKKVEEKAHQNGEGPINNKTDKNKDKRKLKKKKKKSKKNRLQQQLSVEIKREESEDEVEIEYVPAPVDFDATDPQFGEFAKIFDRFKLEESSGPENADYSAEIKQELKQEEGLIKADDEENEEGKGGEKGLSNKKKKELKRLKIAVLKQLVTRPDVVEVHDVNSADPALLVYLKSYKNTVPVPKHWSQKKKFLQGKRGVEKPPFQLPDFIAATGIQRIREAVEDKENAKKSKQKQRERMQPKMGKVDIDYQVLHDAFFKYQTKPKLTIHGDLYFEGKEFEIKLKEKKPGSLSVELRKAMGMPEGSPPPWLINQQRYGPPPSYPFLKIPGLNAPIPPGAEYGFHPGGWGKPPVDENGIPLYGDVFGSVQQDVIPETAEPIERFKWGELEEEEEQEEQEEEDREGGISEAADESGLETPSGIASVPSGIETPDTIDLRKVQKKMPEDEGPKQLFQVLDQTDAKVSGSLYGSSHKYVIPGTDKSKTAGSAEKSRVVDLMKSQKTEKVNITLNPSDLENLEDLTDDVVKEKYEQALAEKAESSMTEDYSDILAEQQRKQLKRKKEKDTKDGKSKKYKDFKF